MRLLPLLVLAPLVTACGAGRQVNCSAVGWTNAVTVELDDSSPDVPPGSVSVDPGGHGATVPLSGQTAVAHIGMRTPDSVVVTVVAADGTRLTRASIDLRWHRTGGTAECGGPSVATARVPAP